MVVDLYAEVPSADATPQGLEIRGSVLEAITREVSTVTLGKVVLQHASLSPEEPPLDWAKIDAIYNTRNMEVFKLERSTNMDLALRWGDLSKRWPASSKSSRDFRIIRCGIDQFNVLHPKGRALSVPLDRRFVPPRIAC